MRFCLFLAVFVLTGSLLPAQDSLQHDSSWKQYASLGGANASNLTGPFAYYRLNRRTAFTFRDLRFFAYGFEKNSFIYLRYKSSNKKLKYPHLYTFSTISYRKNTRAGVNLQYHFNQGGGWFISDYKAGLLNLEIGHAFDMSDYLNENQKTSYLKAGVYWDHDAVLFSSKIEVEYFYQISDLNLNNLTRTQLVVELNFPVVKDLSININYELEAYGESKNSAINSTTIALNWRKSLGWKL